MILAWSSFTGRPNLSFLGRFTIFATLSAFSSATSSSISSSEWLLSARFFSSE